MNFDRAKTIQKIVEISLETSEKMLSFGSHLTTLLPPNSILALFGDLGAGKTTFVQGLGLGLKIHAPIQSPTFNYLNIYEGILSLYHFDLYRLKTHSDFFSLGFEEYLEKQGIIAIEWPERILPILPLKTISITFSYKNSGRIATLTSPFALDLLNLDALWD